MYLIKSLQKNHRTDALLMGRVRIGTINYYREIEDEARADGEEGLGKIVWIGQKLEQEHHNKIFSPFEGFQLNDGWSIDNKGCPLHGSYPSFNAYTYCYSEVEKVDEIAATSGEKGDSFVCVAKPKKFVGSVIEQLKPIIVQDIMNNSPHDEIDQILKTFKIREMSYRINYDDQRKDRLVDESNVEDFNPMAFHPQDFFQKDSSYRYEREVRTLWLLVANHPVTGAEVPLSIPNDRKFEDIRVEPNIFSSKLVEHGLNLKVSQKKPPNV